MALEREGFEFPEILTPNQRQAAEGIIESLDAARDQRKCIMLDGVSGVGKSTLLQEIATAINLHSGKIVDPNDIRYQSKGADLEQFQGHMVTTSTVGEFRDKPI